ncbi:MAG: CDGSH iron-sulfur domain-containing protein [Pseudomonadota bacterium]
MKKTEIKLLDDGPILVTGDFALLAADGKVIGGSGESPTALCRCGASAKKPYCDGAHKQAGFKTPR